ncbi:hypothetical protein ACFOPN_20900 [Xanthomonas hyacinthi]|uniref:hypothetical protein n=1 Tax=Xanthomonas hyacinthi TaxID=56455 RepID=UPI0036155855
MSPVHHRTGTVPVAPQASIYLAVLPGLDRCARVGPLHGDRAAAPRQRALSSARVDLPSRLMDHQ